MTIKAVIFDLDGVIVSTDEFHYRAWKELADEERIYFDREINERLRGVSRMESLEILLERSPRRYSPAEKETLATRKNKRYQELLRHLTPADRLPGVDDTLSFLKLKGLPIAIASSSKNAKRILEGIRLQDAFNAVVDGHDIERSKPDPEVFLKAAQCLNVSPAHCLVVEDAIAGVEAALAAQMRVLAVGFASKDSRAHYRAKGLDQFNIASVFLETNATFI